MTAHTSTEVSVKNNRSDALIKYGALLALLIFLLLMPEDSSAGTIKDAMALDLRLEFAEPNFISESPEHSGQDVWAWGGQDSEPYAGQSALAQLNIVPAHEFTRGAGSLVAVIDTGVQLDHPALASHLVPGLDLVDGDLEPADTGNNQDDDGDGARQVGQHDEAEPVERAGAVHLRRFHLFGIQRLDRRQQDQGGKRQPLPGDDQNDREQWKLR